MSIEEIPESGHITLPNGATLYWEPDKVGGRIYYSDEVGPLMDIWNTALVDSATLLAALTQEATIQVNHRYWEKQRKEK